MKSLKTHIFRFRCIPAEAAEFKRQARAEGFQTVSSWMLWHLRRAVREWEARR